MQNIDQMLEHWKDTPYLVLTSELYVSFVNICKKIYRIITAPRCMWSSLDLILAHGVLTLPNHCVSVSYSITHYNKN